MENGDTHKLNGVQREEGKCFWCRGPEEGSGEKPKVRLSSFLNLSPSTPSTIESLGRRQRVGRAGESWRIWNKGGFLISQGMAWGGCTSFNEVEHSVYSVCRAARHGCFEMSEEEVYANQVMLALLVPMVYVCHLGSRHFSWYLWGLPKR